MNAWFRRSLADAWADGRNNFNLIRLVAAWLVIYGHAWAITGSGGGDLVTRLTQFKFAGGVAVDVFFVVSGFLIAASLQRQFLSSAAGELPPDQCLPEVWISDDGQLEQARRLLDQLLSVPQRRWNCVCGELVEGGFESCWSCGRPMP